MSNLYNNTIPGGGSFDDYDSIEGEFSIQMNQTDDESMAMSELGSVLGGVSVVGQQQRGNAPTMAPPAANRVYGYTATQDVNQCEIQQIKSSEEEIYEDDTNTSYDASMPEDCASFMNSEIGISAGDVSAILFGGRSANYQSSGNDEGYMNGLFGSHRVSSGYDSNLDNTNTSVDDTIGDLFARDDNTEMASIIGPAALDIHLQKPKTLGPLGDELSYAQDDSTAPPPAEQYVQPVYKSSAHLHVETGMMEDEHEEDEEVTSGILPVWLSTSNSRMKSLLVVSAALIVGSLVMAVVALGANSHWWAADDSKDGGGMASLSSEMEDLREIPLGEPTSMPSFEPSIRQTRKPTKKPSKSPVSEETGESALVDVAATTTEATQVETTTSEATTTTEAETTSTAELTTKMTTDAPTLSLTPSTSSPIVSPTLTPTDSPFDSPSLPPSGKPVTALPTPTPTTKPSEEPTLQPVTDVPTISPSEAPVTKTPTKTPTSSPSIKPTKNPITKSPTVSPSSSPSTKPTLSPSQQPSVSPTTKSPSTSPTLGPSDAPSTRPSTAKPTTHPTASMAPSMSVGSEATIHGDATFYLMAEGGTNVAYWKNKLETLDVEKNGAKFLVHLGSAVRKVDDCIESAYVKTEQSLKSTPVTAYAVPGNYDWPTCTNSTRGLNLWKKHFTSINTKWPKPAEYSVKRDDERSENFAFLWKRIMFVGLHVVQSEDDDETAARIQGNLDWVNKNVESRFDDIDVIFMMGNGRFMAPYNIPFYNDIVTKKQNEWKDKYVIYARRAAETGVLKNIGGLDKFDELRVGAEWPILDVQVSTKIGLIGPGSDPKLRYREVKDVDDVAGKKGMGSGELKK